MKLFDLLKQFKTIQPDPIFIERSKREILLSPQSEQKVKRSIFTFLHVIESGAAVVLAGFFILVITGSFPGAHSIAPIQYSVIDPQGLHAEAEAVDMQIQLADLNYPQVTSTALSPVASPAAIRTAFSRAVSATSSAAVSTPSEASGTATSTTSTLSVDQALQKLSQ